MKLKLVKCIQKLTLFYHSLVSENPLKAYKQACNSFIAPSAFVHKITEHDGSKLLLKLHGYVASCIRTLQLFENRALIEL